MFIQVMKWIVKGTVIFLCFVIVSLLISFLLALGVLPLATYYNFPFWEPAKT